jgi:hypothetical protein
MPTTTNDVRFFAFGTTSVFLFIINKKRTKRISDDRRRTTDAVSSTETRIDGTEDDDENKKQILFQGDDAHRGVRRNGNYG